MPAHIPLGAVALLALVGCPPKVPPGVAPPVAALPPAAGVVQVQVDPTLARQNPARKPPAEVAALQVLDGARPRAASCYQAALARDVAIHGEVLVRVVIDPGGRVRSVEAVMDTVGDRELVSCVERLVEALRFPAPGQEGLNLRYPFLFSTDLTPPEVVRAMLAAHGLIEEEAQRVDVEDPERESSSGTVETW
jgi:TonB family protein